MVDIHDYDIQCIENEILMKYNDFRNDYSECSCLLSLRKDIINKRVLAHQEDILSDIQCASLVTITLNFILCRGMTDRICGMQSVIAGGIVCMKKELHYQRSHFPEVMCLLNI